MSTDEDISSGVGVDSGLVVSTVSGIPWGLLETHPPQIGGHGCSPGIPLEELDQPIHFHKVDL